MTRVCTALRDKFDGIDMLEDGLENNPDISRRALAALHEGAFRWALSLTDYDAQAAQDVMQQAYLALLDGSARYNGDAALKTWLFAVIRNCARRYHRTQRQQQGVAARLQRLFISDTEVAVPDTASLADETSTTLRAAVARLPVRQRQVLELVIDAEFSIEQAARVVGISTGSARTHYHRAKQTLRAALRETLKDDYEHR